MPGSYSPFKDRRLTLLGRRRPPPPPSKGVGAALPVPVATWVSAGDDNTPELSVDVGIGAMVEDDAYVWQFDTVNTFDGADFFEVPGTVNSTDALDGDIDETITELADDTWYARFRVTGKTNWSNIISQTIATLVTFDSTSITFDSTAHTFDEAA